MCLVALAWKTHPRWRLLLAGNRDEFHERPTAPLAQWAAPAERVLAGRDLRSGGSWVGLGLDGRAAVVTNVRDPLVTASGRSRGHLIADYLSGSADAATYARELAAAGQSYRPSICCCATPSAASTSATIQHWHAPSPRESTACPTARWMRTGPRPPR